MPARVLTSDEEHRLPRDVVNLERICRLHPHGFDISSMPTIQKILELSLSLIHRGAEEMVKPVESLLRYSS